MNKQKLLPVFSGLFTMTLIISNILDVKLFKVIDLQFFSLTSINMPAGVIVFPIAYIFGDILTEVYGYSVSRKVIWTGFLALIFFILFSEIAIRLKPSEGWNLQNEFSTVLSHIPRLVTASIIAYLCGEFVNSFIVAKMKVYSKGRNIAFRFFLSTLFGQFVDTFVFIIIAYAGIFNINLLISVLISAWIFKVAWETVALPITIPLVRRIKRYEQEDYYDYNTDFNPFKFKE